MPFFRLSVRYPLMVTVLLAGIVACTIAFATGNTAAGAHTHVLHGAGTVLSVRQQQVYGPAKRVAIAPAKKAPFLLPVVDHDDILPKHRVLADNTFRALPSLCRDSLKEFYVVYKNPTNRGLAGESVMIIAGNVPDAEFRALIVHECGHIVDLGGIRGTAKAGKTDFYDGSRPIYADDPSVRFYGISWTSATTKQTSAKAADFVSGYAMSDPFEDFSESFAFFILQRKEFARLAEKNPRLKAKYDYIAGIVNAQPDIAVGKYVRGKKEPWDVTKLPYVWVGGGDTATVAMAGDMAR